MNFVDKKFSVWSCFQQWQDILESIDCRWLAGDWKKGTCNWFA